MWLALALRAMERGRIQRREFAVRRTLGDLALSYRILYRNLRASPRRFIGGNGPG